MPFESELQTMAGEDMNPKQVVNNSDIVDDVKEWHCHDGTVRDDTVDRLARNQLVVVSILCFLFMIGETVGGVLSNSLALFTDVLHLASDLIGFLISLVSIYLARKPATENMSFGYHRAEVLGALINVAFIWSVTGILIYVAVERIIQEHYKNVKAEEMLITASIGVIFNIIMAIILQSDICFGRLGARPSFGHSHGKSVTEGSNKRLWTSVEKNNSKRPKRREYETFSSDKDPGDKEKQVLSSEVADDTRKHKPKNINVRAAFIHVLGDIIQSIGVLLAAVIIIAKPEDKYKLADPICTFLFSILVLFTTINVLRDTFRIILEGVPREICYRSLREHLQGLSGVQAVHGLTVWSLTLQKNSMAVHLTIDSSASHQQVLTEASKLLADKYNFYNTAIQVEFHQPEVMNKCFSCTEMPR